MSGYYFPLRIFEARQFVVIIDEIAAPKVTSLSLPVFEMEVTFYAR